MNRKNHCTRAIRNSTISRYLIAALIPASLFLFASCSGKAIGDAQNFDPNDAPSIESISVTNPNGSAVESSKIEPFTSFAVTVTAADPDNDALSYSFTSNCGSFSQITPTATGCTAVFKTGNISGGQKLKLSAKASDSKGGSSNISYGMGSGKIGPTVTALLSRTRITPDGMMTLSVRANCSGLFQIVPDGTLSSTITFGNDMMNYTYSENGTTSCVIAGPTCTLTAGNIKLPAKATYTNNTNYDIAIVFRDGLFQGDTMVEKLFVDGTKPSVSSSSPADDAYKIPLSSTASFTFDEPMDPASFASSNLTITGGTVGTITFTGYNDNTRTATFTVNGLSKCVKYTATLDGSKDIAGNTINTASPSFTTIPFSVTFNKDDATAGTAPLPISDYSVTLPDRNLCDLYKYESPNHYGFRGWAATSGGTAVPSIPTPTGDKYTPTSDITLYPVWGDLAIGDRGPAGGWIFVANDSISNDPDGEWKYMEVAPYVAGVTEHWADWESNGRSINSFSFPTSPAPGAGLRNTININNFITTTSFSDNHYKANVCWSYEFSYNGYNDWYTPSYWELDEIYVQYCNNKIGEFATGESPRYYSSTEVDANKTWYFLFANSTDSNHNFSKGIKYSSDKSDRAVIRPVRRFK